MKSESPEDREYAYRDRRAWLEGMVANAVARAAGKADDATALDVANSYMAAFHPVALPAKGHDYRMPDGSIEHDGTYAVLPKAEDHEDKSWGKFVPGANGERTPRAVMLEVSMDSGGGFVRDRDGRIVRDRREVARLLRGEPGLLEFTLSMLAEPTPAGRKRLEPWTLARGLLFADLQPALGTRLAARLLLAWEDELGAPWRTPGAAGLVARFQAGAERGADERRTLRRAEQTMVRSCRRAGVGPRRPGNRNPVGIEGGPASDGRADGDGLHHHGEDASPGL